ncbi:MAG TPA: DUF1800 domain-containing protein [Rubrivivax sp.]|nr:DUF1800 domain-containing protein [Rubrivivax sp.]
MKVCTLFGLGGLRAATLACLFAFGSPSSLAQGAVDRPASTLEAGRFLAQATFGPTGDDIERLMKAGYGSWIDQQLALPATSHRLSWEAADAAIRAAAPGSTAGQNEVFESFWKQAVTGPDQLRQRMAFALSEIFVISMVDSAVGNEPRAVAAWLDMLGDKGLTTYRQLLEAVALHPMMGRYLSHLRNQKADPATGRVPDQNFAREVMQLFSIGLVQLNADGTPALVGGQPVETYTPDDVAGLAKVFTGWSWDCPAAPNNSCFSSGASGGVSDPDRQWKPMVPYPQYHSTEAKTFLGVTIPAQTTADPRTSLRVALDRLTTHPNTAPFFSRQLIQRLVTSNPSPGYVAAVAAVFANNGNGVRGDLKAVLRAVLLHPEARLYNNASGKLREPVLRLSAFLRAFPHASDTGRWRVGNTDSPANSLGQTPLRAPSVFNFFRPGYTAPGTLTAAAGMVAPEMQLVNETSVSGFINFMRDNLSSGVGAFNGTVGTTVFNRRDLQRNWSQEMEYSSKPELLVRVVTQRLLYGQASAALRADIEASVASIAIPALNASGSNLSAVQGAMRNRVYAAVLLTMATPEFLTQK